MKNKEAMPSLGRELPPEMSIPGTAQAMEPWDCRRAFM